jgi:hypothetical protein
MKWTATLLNWISHSAAKWKEPINHYPTFCFEPRSHQTWWLDDQSMRFLIDPKEGLAFGVSITL